MKPILLLLSIALCGCAKHYMPTTPMPALTRDDATYWTDTDPRLATNHIAEHISTRYRAICTCCKVEQVLKPLSVQTSGGMKVDGGTKQSGTATFQCGVQRCQKIFTIPTADVFVPDPTPATPIGGQ